MTKEIFTSVIVPTYKEVKNIPVLVKKIDDALRIKKIKYEVIIIDDNSNDGTIKAVDALREKYPVSLIVRTDKRGLSSAVVEGIRCAHGNTCVVMDADLSHPPEKIPDLIYEITNGAEFSIGSRFVSGGSAEHFNLFRKCNAWISKIFALPFTRVKDPMAGFFAFPRSLIKNIDSLNPLGFKIGLEIMVKCSPKKISEIPIIFHERLYGESKLSIKEQINYILHLLRLFDYKYYKLSEVVKFGLAGTGGMILDLSCVHVSYGLFGIPFRVARITGFVLALTANFFINRKVTFHRAKRRNVFYQYIEFFVICVIGFAINWYISVRLFENYGFFNRHYLIASFIGVVCGFVVNFIGSKNVVFRK
jgi:dolichol-phosphate mannosyltransferase